MKIEISKLNPHPLNYRIYGHEDNLDELVEKIKSSDWIKPILVNSQNTIISGHRRVESCKILGITEVEFELVEDDLVKQLELLVGENFYRVKTTTQQMKESEIFFDIEKKKSYQRQIEIGKQNLGQVSDEVKWTQLGETGRTTQIVSKKVGMSETSYKRGRKVMEYIKDNPEFEWVFENTLNESIDQSLKLTEKPPEFIEKVIELVDGDKHRILPVIRELEKEEMRTKTPLPPGKYGVIILDITNKETDDISNTDISSICEDDCLLFLWVKPQQVYSGIRICKHWGFKYQTCLFWNKDHLKEITLNGELLLVSVKGSPNVIFREYEDSSEKPELFEEIIREGYHDISKVELQIGEGWKIWC
jgi:hypothetical protein